MRYILTIVFSIYTIIAHSQSGNIISEQEKINFNPDVKYGNYVDSRDHKSYKTVIIGHRTWMAENMAYLPFINSIYQESLTKPMYYIYGYEGSSIKDAIQTDNFKTYGVLYNFEAALKVCPDGWHLPTHEDWETLTNALRGDITAGNEMKEQGTNHWITSSKSTTNESGFTVLPAGSISYEQDWNDLGRKANYWVNKTRDSKNSFAISFAYYSSWAAGSYFPRSSGLSVRCLKN